MKEKCSLCQEESAMGATVSLMARTESGELIDAWSNKDQSLSVMLPFCKLHLCMLEQGLVYTDGKTIFCAGTVNYERFKDASDADIRAAIKEHKSNPEASIGVATLRAIQTYRKVTAVHQ